MAADPPGAPGRPQGDRGQGQGPHQGRPGGLPSPPSSPDPYVTLSIGDRTVSYADEYIENTVCPEWDYRAEFPLEQLAGTSLGLEVWDWDRNKEDDFLGRCSLDLSGVVAEERRSWERLQGVRTGEVLVSLAWSPALAAPLPGGRYALTVLIDSCTGLGPGKGQPPRLGRCEASLGDMLGAGEIRKHSTFKENIKQTFKWSSAGSREK